MVPWQELGRARVPRGELVLARRGDEFAIRLGGAELMNSRSHASEELLATAGCSALRQRFPKGPLKVLIGGLGMGFTARAALDALGPNGRVTVAELVPEVVDWNRGPLAALARRPLDDARVELRVGDVAAVIAGASAAWHAILLDVDNGPDAFTAPANARLYARAGLLRARRALLPGGVLGVWSVAQDRDFSERLRACEFDVEVLRCAPRGNRGAQHVVWLARV